MAVLDRLIGRASPATALRRAIQLGEERRYAEAFPLLTLAARAGIPDAEYRVARCYFEGSGVPRSQVEGGRWLPRAASHGCIEAPSPPAALCVHGLAGVASNDPIKADEPRADRLFAVDGAAGRDLH